jgi:hypothetical protein
LRRMAFAMESSSVTIAPSMPTPCRVLRRVGATVDTPEVREVTAALGEVVDEVDPPLSGSARGGLAPPPAGGGDATSTSKPKAALGDAR